MSVTPVGSRVFVASKADLDPDDPAFGDQDPDLFELRGDSWKIWTTGPNDQPTGTDWFWRSLISEDGRYVYFESMQRLTAADQDDELDVYQRYAGQTRLITIPAANETSGQSWRTHLANIAPDGETAYFFAFERMTLDDSEALSPDLFAWRDGQTTRITGGTNDTIYEPTDLVGASRDGSRVFFNSRLQLTPADTDNETDVYLHRPGQPLTLVSLAAPGTPPCERRHFCSVAGAGVSLDGTRLIFYGSGQFHPADDDWTLDVYMWHAGDVSLISKDEAPGSRQVWFAGMSRDGRRVALQTDDRLLESDNDGGSDAYLWVNGRVVLASPGTGGDTPETGAFIKNISPSGNHLLFGTRDSFSPYDIGGYDIYDAVVTESSARPAKRAGPRRRPRVRLRLITHESIPPRFSIASTGRVRRGSARVRVGCSRKEQSGPCRGKLILKTSSGRRLGVQGFRAKPGHMTTVVVDPGRRHFRAGMRVQARVRGSDRFGNRASARRTVTLQGA